MQCKCLNKHTMTPLKPVRVEYMYPPKPHSIWWALTLMQNHNRIVGTVFKR